MICVVAGRSRQCVRTGLRFVFVFLFFVFCCSFFFFFFFFCCCFFFIIIIIILFYFYFFLELVCITNLIEFREFKLSIEILYI